jgi:hypothetical protein
MVHTVEKLTDIPFNNPSTSLEVFSDITYRGVTGSFGSKPVRVHIKNRFIDSIQDFSNYILD